MKKFASILLAIAMILSMSITAFADDNASITTERTYNGYKLLNLTTSLKPDCGCENDEGHEDDCYNYAYTVNDKYTDILQTEAGKDDDGNDIDIIAYLNDLTGDVTSGSVTIYGTLREAADSIYRAILTENIDADATKLTGTTEIEQGYWLFADVTDLDDKKDEANSLVIVDTKGKEELTITPKIALPTLVKKVKDINDSTGVTSGWQDSADYDINDVVPFQLTATLPENIASYEEYSLTFHDTLSAGLTLDSSSIEVSVGNIDVTEYFGRPTSEVTGTSFEISCEDILSEDILSIEDITITKDTVFVVTYSATLNENAAIGEEGNPNTAYLEFSNNPYDSNSTGKTAEDKVIVFTYQLTVNKVDETSTPLKGAGFTLYKKNSSAGYAPIGEELVGGDMTTFVWKGIDDGDYKLVETTVPEGYNKMADKEFSITAEHDEENDEPALTSLTSDLGTATNGDIGDTITNHTGAVLPETGAAGTMLLIGGGAMFVMIAAVIMITRKKMSVYED